MLIPAECVWIAFFRLVVPNTPESAPVVVAGGVHRPR
jgi:hypothetical protein